MNAPESQGRWANIYQAMTGATAPGEHHEQPMGTSPESSKAGHEPDRFDAKGILIVPVLVVVVTILAYIMVTGVFRYIEPGKSFDSPTMSPLATVESRQPFNERIERISSTDDKAKFHQPRLEYIMAVENQRPGVSQADPVFLRSFAVSPKNNTYEIKPQDLYPSRFVDPRTGQKLLAEWEWIAKDKHVARIPVDAAMHLLAGQLPANKDGKAPLGSRDGAKASNGGQALPPGKPVAAEPAKGGH